MIIRISILISISEKKGDGLRHPDPLSDTTSTNKHEYKHKYIESNREPDKNHQSKNLLILDIALVQKYQKCKI